MAAAAWAASPWSWPATSPSCRISDATFCVSRQNEIFSEFKGLGFRLLPVDTFEDASGALVRGYRVRTPYHNVLDELVRQRSAALVTLMPHIWTPLFAPLIRKHGFRYLTIKAWIARLAMALP